MYIQHLLVLIASWSLLFSTSNAIKMHQVDLIMTSKANWLSELVVKVSQVFYHCSYSKSIGWLPRERYSHCSVSCAHSTLLDTNLTSSSKFPSSYFKKYMKLWRKKRQSPESSYVTWFRRLVQWFSPATSNSSTTSWNRQETLSTLPPIGLLM